MEPEASSNDHKHDNHGDHILSYTDKLKCDGMFCDITIKVGDSEFGAHKLVLASASEYFEGMFRSNLSEASTGVVTFPDENPAIMRACIEYIYSGKVDVSEENVTELLDASEMMVLPGLSSCCVTFLASRVDVASCAYIMSLSWRYRKEKLDSPLRSLLLEKFDEIAVNEDFVALESNVLVYCLKLLHGGGLELEMQKWFAILSWVKHNYDKRKEDFPALFESLDIWLFSKDFTRRVILEEPVVQESPSSLLSIARLHTDESQDTRPRKRKAPMSHLVVCKPKQQSQIIVKYDIGSKQWSVIGTFPGELDELAHFVTHENRLFVGTGNKIYEFANDVWRSGCPIKAVNRMFSSCVGACKLCNLTCPINQASFCYNRCIVVDHCVFMLTSQFMYELNILTSKLYHYTVGVDLGEGFFIAASNDKIFAFGGEGTENHAIEIDLKTKTRSRLCNMNNPKRQGHAFWYDDKPYVLGGDKYPTCMECYVPEEDTWLSVSGAQVPCHPKQIHLGPSSLQLIYETSPVHMSSIKLDKLRRRLRRPSNSEGTSSLCCPSTS